jgi:hypothetical protein
MDYEKPNVVSVWIGNLASKESLEELLAESEDGASRFAASLGVGWIDHDFCESLFVSRRVSVAELVGCFSYADSFLDAVLESAVARSLPDVNAAILLFDFDYSLAPTEPEIDGMLFVGSYPYDKRSSPRFPVPV